MSSNQCPNNVLMSVRESDPSDRSFKTSLDGTTVLTTGAGFSDFSTFSVCLISSVCATCSASSIFSGFLSVFSDFSTLSALSAPPAFSGLSIFVFGFYFTGLKNTSSSILEKTSSRTSTGPLHRAKCHLIKMSNEVLMESCAFIHATTVSSSGTVKPTLFGTRSLIRLPPVLLYAKIIPY